MRVDDLQLEALFRQLAKAGHDFIVVGHHLEAIVCDIQTGDTLFDSTEISLAEFMNS